MEGVGKIALAIGRMTRWERIGFGWVSASSNSYLLADLRRDGSIGYLVRARDFPGMSSTNNFHLERARITAFGKGNLAHHNVPDGGHSLTLLALGLIALAGGARIAKNPQLGLKRCWVAALGGFFET